MDKRIIYLNEEGGIGIITPTSELSIIEIARKDTPAGAPYRVIDASYLPQDFTFRLAWEDDFSSPDGFGIGQDAWYVEQAAKEQA